MKKSYQRAFELPDLEDIFQGEWEEDFYCHKDFMPDNDVWMYFIHTVPSHNKIQVSINIITNN